MSPRIIAVDDAYSQVIVHYEGGTTDTFSTWSDMLKVVDLADVETFNFFFDDTDSYHQTGVAPLTAYPAQDATQKRSDGQGCTSCKYRSGCLATQGLRGQGDANFSDAMGTACTSWVEG